MGKRENKGGTSGPICRLLPSLTDSWGRSLVESVLGGSPTVPDEEHLLKAADGRIKCPEIDVHDGGMGGDSAPALFSNYSFLKKRGK